MEQFLWNKSKEKEAVKNLIKRFPNSNKKKVDQLVSELKHEERSAYRLSISPDFFAKPPSSSADAEPGRPSSSGSTRTVLSTLSRSGNILGHLCNRTGGKRPSTADTRDLKIESGKARLGKLKKDEDEESSSEDEGEDAGVKPPSDLKIESGKARLGKLKKDEDEESSSEDEGEDAGVKPPGGFEDLFAKDVAKETEGNENTYVLIDIEEKRFKYGNDDENAKPTDPSNPRAGRVSLSTLSLTMQDSSILNFIKDETLSSLLEGPTVEKEQLNLRGISLDDMARHRSLLGVRALGREYHNPTEFLELGYPPNVSKNLAYVRDWFKKEHPSLKLRVDGGRVTCSKCSDDLVPAGTLANGEGRNCLSVAQTHLKHCGQSCPTCGTGFEELYLQYEDDEYEMYEKTFQDGETKLDRDEFVKKAKEFMKKQYRGKTQTYFPDKTYQFGLHKHSCATWHKNFAFMEDYAKEFKTIDIKQGKELRAYIKKRGKMGATTVTEKGILSFYNQHIKKLNEGKYVHYGINGKSYGYRRHKVEALYYLAEEENKKEKKKMINKFWAARKK